jgi:hypothetical protein
MTREEANRLMAELGAEFKVADLALDESGELALSVDERISLRIVHDKETGDILLSTPLTGVTATPARQARALAASFCWTDAGGAVFGLDTASGQLVLQRHCPGASIDLAGLTGALESLVEHNQAWTRLLGEIAGEPATAAERPLRGAPIQTA